MIPVTSAFPAEESIGVSVVTGDVAKDSGVSVVSDDVAKDMVWRVVSGDVAKDIVLLSVELKQSVSESKQKTMST